MAKSKCVLFRQARLLMTVALAILLMQIVVLAQAESGGITGTVTDQNGAVVPGASIVAKNEKTGEYGNNMERYQKESDEIEHQAKGFEIDRRKLQLADPIKKISEVDVPVKLHRDVTATIKVKVVPDES